MLARDRGIGRRCRFNSFGRSTPLTPLTPFRPFRPERGSELGLWKVAAVCIGKKSSGMAMDGPCQDDCDGF